MRLWKVWAGRKRRMNGMATGILHISNAQQGEGPIVDRRRQEMLEAPQAVRVATTKLPWMGEIAVASWASFGVAHIGLDRRAV